MNLEFKRFIKEYYSKYASWFTDPVLNFHLGPMDKNWLEAVLSVPESRGGTWAVFRSAELVAVIETVFDPDNKLPAVITAVAVNPALRQQGICATVLEQILALHKTQGISEHVAYVSMDNVAGQRCFEKVGFATSASKPNEHGYIKFRRRQ